MTDRRASYASRSDAAVFVRRNTTSWEEDGEAREMVARNGAHTLQEVAVYLGVTRERVRQIEEKALRRLEKRAGEVGMREFLERDAHESPAEHMERHSHGDVSYWHPPRRSP